MPDLEKMLGFLPPTQREFIGFLQKVNGISKSTVSPEQRRTEYSKCVDALSADTYNQYFLKIVEIIQKRKEECLPFQTSEEQVNDVVKWMPRLKDNYSLVLLAIRERRKKYKLAV